MIKKLILLLIAVVISGCTTMTNLEQTPVYDSNRVVEKDGLLYEKGGIIDKPINGYFAAGTQDGNATAVFMEVEEGKMMNGWCHHPKIGRKYTVIDGNGAVICYDYVTGEEISSRKVKDGRLEPMKEFEIGMFEFSPYPKESWTSPRTAVAMKPSKKNEREGKHQAEPFIAQLTEEATRSQGCEGDAHQDEAEGPQVQLDPSFGYEPIDARAKPNFTQTHDEAVQPEESELWHTRTSEKDRPWFDLFPPLKQGESSLQEQGNQRGGFRPGNSVPSQPTIIVVEKPREHLAWAPQDSENSHDNVTETEPIFDYQKKHIPITILIVMAIASLGLFSGIVIARFIQPGQK